MFFFSYAATLSLHREPSYYYYFFFLFWIYSGTVNNPKLCLGLFASFLFAEVLTGSFSSVPLYRK